MNDNETLPTVQAPRPSALAVMANRFSVEPNKLLETLKATVFRDAKSNEQLMALVIVANEHGLNPFTRQIYAFPDKGGGIVPVISIDGWISMMTTHPAFDGIEFSFVEGGDGKPHSCTATISVKGRSKAVAVTEYYGECFRNTDPWRSMPRRMLRHKALIQCCRVAFGFSGLDPDEAESLEQRFANAKPVFTPHPEIAKALPFAPAPPLEAPQAPEATPTPATPQPRRGRPPGTKNKPPVETVAAPTPPPAEPHDEVTMCAPEPEPTGTNPVGLTQPQIDIMAWVEDHGCAFPHFVAAATKNSWIKDADSLTGWADISDADATRLMANRAAVLNQTLAAKG